MTFVRSLLLGSAALIGAMDGASAADLPAKAKAIEYVRVCSLYGAGFYYVPGTDTCIKLSGYLRVEAVENSNAIDAGNVSGPGGAQNRFTNGFTWRSRQNLEVDTRTATEYGVVRTFGNMVFGWTDDIYTANPALSGASTYAALGGSASVSPASAPGNANAGAVGYGTVGVYNAFIQFAGFTIGRTISPFSAPWGAYPGNNFDGLVGGTNTTTGVNQFAYTASFGNGVSAAIAAVDHTQYFQAGVNNLSAGGAYGAADYAGTVAPDIVAAVTIDQDWGFFKASVAAHDNHAAYYGANETTGHPGDVWGWAGAMALSIKNIPTGPGDTVNIQGVYTDGATRYDIQEIGSAYGSQLTFGGTKMPGAYQSVGIAMAPDTVFAAGTSQQTIQTWGIRGAFTHNWNAYWNSALYGAYGEVRYNTAAKSLICGPNGTFRAAFGSGVTNCDPNFAIAQIGFITRWTPVRNLTFSADVHWSRLDQKYAGSITTSSSSVSKPAAVYELRDQDTWAMLLRAQRNF